MSDMDPRTAAILKLPPLPLPEFPVSEWNQPHRSPDIYDPPEVGYSSFEEGLLQRVRDLHVKVENYLKALPVNEESITEVVNALIGIDCPLPAKFTKVNVAELIKKNKNIRGAESLPVLVAALGLLEKYGRNLLKPKRPPMWKFINFANSVFRTRVDIIKGARNILQLMGYSEEVEDGLCFPSDTESPPINTVAVVIADLIIAKREIDQYNKGQHPHEYRIKDCLEGTMITVTAESPSGNPHNIFMRHSDSTKKTMYENFDIVRPPPKMDLKGIRKPPQTVLTSSHDTQVTLPGITVLDIPSKPKMSTPTVNPTSSIVCKIGDPQPSFMQKPSAVGLEYLANPPGVPTKPATQTDPKMVESSIIKTEDRSVTSQSTECVMCGRSAANIQCSTCSGLRCESCDNKMHQHPNRRSHSRCVIDPTPVIDTILCHICGTKPASLYCASCSSDSCSGEYCSECDEVCHGHPQRKAHSRQPLESRQSNPTTINQPQSNIVLSPISSALTAKESSSGSSSLPNRKRPVPAPRRSVNDKEQMRQIIFEEQESQDDVFMPEEAKDPQSKLKVPSQQPSRHVKSESQPFHSLPTTRADVASQVEEVVSKDILVLQEMQTKRDALTKCQKGSYEYRTIQMEIAALANKHIELLNKQNELELIMTRTEESNENRPLGVEPQQFGGSATTEKGTDLAISRIKYPPAEDASGVYATSITKTEPLISSQPKINIPFTYKDPASKPPTPAKPTLFTSSKSTPDAAPTKPEVSPKSSVIRSQSSPSKTQPKVSDIVTPVGRWPQTANRIDPDSLARSSGPSNSTPPGGSVCGQCGNFVSPTSHVCMTCLSAQPPAPASSVQTLSQQLSLTTQRPILRQQQQHVPIIPPPTSPKPAPHTTAAASQLSPMAAVAVTTNAIKQPDTMSVFTYLQMEEEVMLQEKRKAKEEYDRQMAEQEEKAATMPTLLPRVKKEAKKASHMATITNQPISNQGGIFTASHLKGASASPPPAATVHHHIMFAEERKRLDKLRAESIDLIKTLKEAEDADYLPEEVIAASNKLNESGQSGTMGEVQWLQSYWDDHIHHVTATATNILQKEVGKSLGMVRKEDAVRALRNHYGDGEKAVEECVAHTQDMVLSLVDMGFPHKRVRELLSTRGGGIEGVVIKLQQEIVAEPINRIWQAENDVQQQRLLVDLGVQMHPDTVERRLRMLLAEYELPSWGRAVTATKLIDSRKYEFMDAITAAKECGDMERAKQFLEKECQVCYARFSMNKLSTLSHCQCKICLECLQGYFSNIINNRNILNASCPACDTPDLRGNDLATTEDYFGFLDILLKGILEPESYTLFQNKLRDWNLMKEKNFRWCAHCRNGFINEAPNRRKMRCNECMKITCFLCKKPWMTQHEDTSCAEFQAWKEANDPNRQAEGLAIHLKENGIDCPHCKMRYELAKGGCMHFKCVQCTHEFCSGCSSPFKKVAECNRFASCRQKGFHAHHPRDCLFYLRDADVDDLEKLLQKYNVEYKRENPANHHVVCSVLEQKELPDGLTDDQCGREIVCAGLCVIHYKEYLVSKINENYIDPAEEYSSDILTIILQRNEIEVPPRQRESDKDYRTRLLQEVKRQLPLGEKNPRDRVQSM